MLEFNTKDFSTRKAVKIDGHVYHVRPSGAGDQLKLDRVSQKLMDLAEQIKRRKDKTETAKDLEQIVKIQEEGIRIVSDRYDDGEDGKKAFDLILSMSTEERINLERAIFGQVSPEEIATLEGLGKVEAATGEATDGKART